MAYSHENSQMVSLADIIDNVVALASLNDTSYSNGSKLPAIVLIGKRLLQELGYDVSKMARVHEAEITPANKVIPPDDFVDYARVSLIDDFGELIPIMRNKELSTSAEYLFDEDETLVTDENGYPIEPNGTRDTNDSNTYFFSTTGAFHENTIGYTYDYDAREFLLHNVPDGFHSVVIEYISDPIITEIDPVNLHIHKYFQEAMESGIYLKLIERNNNVPLSEKERARREYYNAVRIGSRRLHMKPEEMFQALQSDRNFNKQ